MRRPKFFLNSILGVVISAAACSNGQPAPSEPGMSPALVALNDVSLLSCSPLGASSTSVQIGTAGGSLSVGPHTLVIPADALSQDVVITATIAAGDRNAIIFQPEGLKFSRPATLTMSFDNCGSWGQLKRLQIVYTDDLLNPKELIPSLANNQTKTISGSIQHFSQYAVAY